MTEQVLSKEDFINFILNGSDQVTKTSSVAEESALPEGFEDFGFDAAEVPATPKDASTFASRLLEAAGFGYPELVQRESVIRSDDAVARYLPERVSYWPKTASRPYQTLLFEDALNHRKLLDIPAFKSRKINHLDIVEDALARLVSEALEGFQRGGDSVTADVRKGNKDETLCVISILDEREGQSARLVCFGTYNKSTNSLETFQITEQTRSWEKQLAHEHLGLVYERQFKKLVSQNWQEAFTTTDERNQAKKLLDVCTSENPTENDIQESILTLLETIAKGFGLRKKPLATRRLQAFALPADHDIGISSEELESKFAGQNPFGGVTLRDERSRLLGYIIYPLKNKADAARLRKHLEQNNRFHNVLVVYPDQEKASLELWQGKEQLTGQLRKGQGHKDAADVVNLLSRFFVVSKAKVKNPTELAQELAYRARYLRRLAVKQLNEEHDKGHLRDLYNAFKEALVHDQTEEEFADAFAQTITYGLLTSRWIGNDQLVKDGERFTRQTALTHLPAASPFLNDLFKSVLAVRLNEQRGRLFWLVDDIADLLDRIDVKYVFDANAGDAGSDKATDPVIHFYEPFLAAYDKELKNKRGVFFTPRPVVSYIVRSVHELLQAEFKLEDGLASTDTWSDVQKNFPDLKLPEGVKPTDPFVCILDPATGTGTFLFECIEVIERTMKARWCRELKKSSWKDDAIVALWNEYVAKHLLSQLYGYEIMMASYAIAHLKLSFKLGETEYHLKEGDRIQVYLTNSLEPPSDSGQQKLTEMYPALAKEAQAVDRVKHYQLFTVIVGNPPYAGHSANKSDWATSLVKDYYKVNGQALNEKNPKYLLDDYVKFIRVACNYLEKSGSGILGFITNNGYLDNPTFRGMRRQLTLLFSKGYLLNLHGSAKKREVTPDGLPDENVFDIQQGVSVCLFRMGHFQNKDDLYQYGDLWGNRESKYSRLQTFNIQGITSWDSVTVTHPYYLLVHSVLDGIDHYLQEGIPITEIFSLTTTGVKTHRDHFAYATSRQEILDRVLRLRDQGLSDKTIREEYDLSDTRDWHLTDARNSLLSETPEDWVSECLYRPFDIIFYYSSGSIVELPRLEIMSNLIGRDNLALGVGRQGLAVSENIWDLAIVSKYPIDTNAFRRGGVQVFPLFIYTKNSESLYGETSCTNFRKAFLDHVRSKLDFLPIPENVFYFIYSQLYSLKYRVLYAPLLEIDFPRIIIPFRQEIFEKLSSLGKQLVDIHLMKPSKFDYLRTTVVGRLPLQLEKISYSSSTNTVWIDKKNTTGFKGVPEDVWNFHIGGYQVCDKWLKDRKGRTLSQEDIEHYQKIIVALSETIRIMQEIDEVIDEHGGWPDAFAKGVGGNE